MIRTIERVAAAALIFSLSTGQASAAKPAPPQQKVTISIDALDPNLQLFGGLAVERILQALLAQPLVRSDANGKLLHVLTDALSRDFTGSRFSLRLKKNARFANGNPVQVVDVVYSLNRCAPAGGEPLRFTSRVSLFSEESADVWLDFPIAGENGYRDTVNALSRCPILSAENSVMFGSQLGSGSNIVGAGEFVISNFKSGVSYQLTRSSVYPERIGPPEIEIIRSEEPRRSLSLLRAGSVDVLLTTDAESISSAVQDTTLQILPCYEKTLIKRKSFNFICPQFYELRDIGYAA